ncbi:MAG: hypothetical protein R3E97_06605 [Candidatus Eisenbacteria bacterium]
MPHIFGRPLPGRAFVPGLSHIRADLHLHSSASYDVINHPALLPRALYERAVERGMGLFTLTDHETMRGIQHLQSELREEYGGTPPIPTVTGIELYVRDPRVGHVIHVNVLGLDRRQASALAKRRRDLDAFLSFCRQESLYHAYNHPFWFEPGERASLDTIATLVAMFPVVEINAGRILPLNHRTIALAETHAKSLVACSDSHTGRVGRAYTSAPGTTPEEFLANVTAGNSVVVPRCTSLGDFLDEVHGTLDLVFSLQQALPIKRTFLRKHPRLRKLAKLALESDRVMKSGWLQGLARRTLGIVAYAPASAFIWEQRQMHKRLEELEAALTDPNLVDGLIEV